jgi:cupin 2 domain-containing protein
VTNVLRGRLADPASAPATGELIERLLDRPGVRIEHIASGTLEAPVDYRLDEDEWVALLTGSARLRVGHDELELAAGDWIFLPAGVEHQLQWTAPGSTWLTVYLAGS